jgi:hypothetical protein
MVSSTNRSAQRPLERVLARLRDTRPSGQGYSARSPIHHDRISSLSIDEGSDGCVLLYCHAGCPTHSVVAALGLTMVDLFPKSVAARDRAGKSRHSPNHSDGSRSIVASYDYRDEAGGLAGPSRGSLTLRPAPPRPSERA